MDFNLNIRFGLLPTHPHCKRSRLVGCFGSADQSEILPVVEHNITIGGAGVKLVLIPKHDETIEPVDGSGVIVFDDPSLFVATPDASDPNGLTFIITTTATSPVSVNGTASVDADLGPGVNTLTFEFTLHAVQPQANVLTGEFTDL